MCSGCDWWKTEEQGGKLYDMAHPVDLVLDATVLHILDLNVRQTLVTAGLLAATATAWFGTPLLTDHRGILGNRLQASRPFSRTQTRFAKIKAKDSNSASCFSERFFENLQSNNS